jgi:flagellin
MPLILFSNVASLQVRAALDRTESATATSLRRLSTGLRINSARDDAAGLAVAARLESQVRGTRQAARNANDGLSLLETGDHALANMADGLQHLRELAVQSLNGTLGANDRQALDTDLQQGLAEIDRTAAAATFNGHAVLDGSYGTAILQVGADAGDTLAVDLSTSMRTTQLGAIATATSADLRTSGGGFQFAGTYTTAAISNLDFSRPAVPFAPGVTSTAAAPPTNFAGGNATTFTVDHIAVALNAAYGTSGAVATAVQQQLDAAAPGAYVANIDGAGHLRVTKTASAAAAPTAPVMAGASGPFAAAFDNATATDGTAASPTTHAGFDVDGHTVSLTTAEPDANALVADIQSQLDRAAKGVYRVSGSAAGISLSHVGDTRLPVVDDFTGAGAAVFGRRAAAGLTLRPGDLTVQVGTGPAVNVTGTFAVPDDLARAVVAQVPGVVANIDPENGTLQVSARQTVTIGGAQSGAGGAIAFSPLVNPPSGSLSTIDVKTIAGARDAVLRIDASLDQVTAQRGALGASEAHLQAIVDQDTKGGAILQAARGRIVDADMAGESSALARSRILQQAGIAMVAQANARSQDVMALLR